MFLFSPAFSYICKRQTHKFIQMLLKQKQKRNSVDPLISLSAIKLGEFVDRMYPIELTIKDSADTVCSASYHDLHVEMSSEYQLRTNHYDNLIFRL